MAELDLFGDHCYTNVPVNSFPWSYDSMRKVLAEFKKLPMPPCADCIVCTEAVFKKLQEQYPTMQVADHVPIVTLDGDSLFSTKFTMMLNGLEVFITETAVGAKFREEMLLSNGRRPLLVT